MIQRPKLKTYLTVFPITDTTWGVQGGSGELWRLQFDSEIAIQALGSILPFLNGRHDIEEIDARVTAHGIELDVVHRVLEQLERSGFVEDGGDHGLDVASAERFRDQLAFFSRFGRDGGARWQMMLREWRIAVVGESLLARALSRQLADAGFTDTVLLREAHGAASDGALSLDRGTIWPSETDEQPPRVVLVAQTAHDPGLLAAMNAYSKRAGVPWLLVRCLDPQEGWVGPLFIPGETASYASLEARLRGNLPFFDEYRAFHEHLERESGPSASCGGLHAVYELLSGIAVIELIKYATGFAFPRLAGRFLTINLLTWEAEMHEVLRVPHLEHESFSKPRIYPWKELPYGDKQTRRA